jgi:hypothetical protein
MATSTREPLAHPKALPVGGVVIGLIFLAFVLWWISSLLRGLGS